MSVALFASFAALIFTISPEHSSKNFAFRALRSSVFGAQNLSLLVSSVSTWVMELKAARHDARRDVRVK